MWATLIASSFHWQLSLNFQTTQMGWYEQSYFSNILSKTNLKCHSNVLTLTYFKPATRHRWFLIAWFLAAASLAELEGIYLTFPIFCPKSDQSAVQMCWHYYLFLTSNAHLENHQCAGNVNHLLHCVTTYQVKKISRHQREKKIVQSELFVTVAYYDIGS